MKWRSLTGSCINDFIWILERDEKLSFLYKYVGFNMNIFVEFSGCLIDELKY